MSKSIDNSLIQKSITGETVYQSIQDDVVEEIQNAASTGVISSIQLADGTVALPSLRFLNSPATGIYASAPDTIDFSIDNFNALDIAETLTTANTDLTVTRGTFNPTTLKVLSANTSSLVAASRLTLETAANNRAAGIVWGNTLSSTHGAYFGQRYQGGSAMSLLTLQGSTSAWNSANAGGSSTGLDRLLINIDSGQIQLSAGTIAAPVLSFQADTDTGFYQSAVSNLDISIDNGNVWNFQKLTTSTSTVLSAAVGSATNASYSFTSDPNTGMFSPAADQVALTTNGTARFTITTASTTSTLPFLASTGTAAAPGLAFASEPDCGFYFTGTANNIGMSIGGTLRTTFSDTQTLLTLPIRGANGTAAAPTYSFSSSATAGMFSAATNTVSFSTSSTTRLQISTLVITPSLPIFGTSQPCLVMRNTVAQSIPSGAETTVTFDTTDLTQGGAGYAPTYSAGTITIGASAAGLYLVCYSVALSSISVTSYSLLKLVNGTTYDYSQQIVPSTTAATLRTYNDSQVINFVAGGTIRLVLSQTSGASVNTDVANRPTLALYKLI